MQAYWNVQASVFFTAEQKGWILEKQQNKINSEGVLMVRSSESRTQLANRKTALEKMLHLVNQSIIRPKKRRATKPTRAMAQKRLDSKKMQSDKKMQRRKDW